MAPTNRVAHALAASADETLASPLSGLAGPWREPDKGRDLSAVERTKLRRVGDQGPGDCLSDAGHGSEKILFLDPGRPSHEVCRTPMLNRPGTGSGYAALSRRLAMPGIQNPAQFLVLAEKSVCLVNQQGRPQCLSSNLRIRSPCSTVSIARRRNSITPATAFASCKITAYFVSAAKATISTFTLDVLWRKTCSFSFAVGPELLGY
jgi:hypothetical protein